MPTALRQHQYELSRSDGTEPLLFGTEDTGYLTITRPQHSGGESRDTDTDRESESGTNFGRDFRASKTVSFEIGVITDKSSVGAIDPHWENLDYLDVIESVWQSEEFREEPGQYALLRACEVMGRTVRAYGRPRRYEEAAGNLTRSGYTPVVCDFKLVDNAWYSDTESTHDATLRPSTDDGFIAPLIAPITTLRDQSVDTSTLVIGGNRKTWPIIEFHGPCVDPTVRVGDYRVGIRGALGEGEVIIFDPAPWSRRAYRNYDGADMSGRLTAVTPAMRRARIKPGVHQVEYRGTDVTGTSFARIRWRTARSRP